MTNKAKKNNNNGSETNDDSLLIDDKENDIVDELMVEDEDENEHNLVDVELLIKENERLKEDFLRAYAEAENVKKRCQLEIEKNNKYAISNFAKELLNVADTLSRAVAAITLEQKNDSASLDNFIKGIELTQNELDKTFTKFGVKKMEIMGNVFDPNFHQVVQEFEDEKKPAGTVIAELQTGYMINDRILREAMVVVTKGGK